MDWTAAILTILGLVLFEVITSVDNAIINASVLQTMQKRYRKWFLFWGIIIGVFLVRGTLPWIIVWLSNPTLGAWGSLLASFSSDSGVIESVERSAPILLIGGGTYLLFLFLHWYFLEPKKYGLIGEKTIERYGVWFFAVVSILLTEIVWFSLRREPMMAFSAVLGSTAFFITHGFKTNAEEQEKKLKKKGMSDVSKIFYLEVIDSTFSIDSVLGAFAFTLSVPLIFIGNGIGAFIVRELTIKGTDKIRHYIYLKNGAMYSIFFLGIIMVLDSFGFHIPSWVSPVVTFFIVGYFFVKSKKELIK
ncbi:MAG TPA: DUF475 domain-containing protein [Candidatus Nanoarchaeia archaeon]|nr:DUF475 domain-containing protein [Candidatus Nanoarchaeia archaeon]